MATASGAAYGGQRGDPEAQCDTDETCRAL